MTRPAWRAHPVGEADRASEEERAAASCRVLILAEKARVVTLIIHS